VPAPETSLAAALGSIDPIKMKPAASDAPVFILPIFPFLLRSFPAKRPRSRQSSGSDSHYRTERFFCKAAAVRKTKGEASG
jgi:hypothetical protein